MIIKAAILFSIRIIYSNTIYDFSYCICIQNICFIFNNYRSMFNWTFLYSEII